MIFKRTNLNENKVLTEAFIQPMSELANGLSDEIKSILEQGASPEKIDWDNPESFFKKGKRDKEGKEVAWTRAFQASSGKDSENLIKLFIQSSLTPKPLSENEVNSWGDILVSLIRQFGFKRSENPFLEFIDKKDFELKKEDVITINNLWADGLITGADVSGNGVDKTKHIIFNPNLYNSANKMSDSKNNSTTDEYNTVKAYHDLSEKYFVKNLNLNAVSSLHSCPNNYKNLSNSMKDSPKDVRNIIIFKDPSNPLGEINSYYWIQRAISSAELVSDEDTQKITTIDKLKDSMQKLDKEDLLKMIASLRKDGTLTDEDVKQINYLVSKED